MKVKIRWIADNQGLQETVIEAINVPAAQSQAKALYGNLPNYTCIGTNVISEPRPNKELPTQVSYVEPTQGVDTSGWELIDLAGWCGLMLAALLILIGLLTMPLGLILIGIGVLLIMGVNKVVSGG